MEKIGILKFHYCNSYTKSLLSLNESLFKLKNTESHKVKKISVFFSSIRLERVFVEPLNVRIFINNELNRLRGGGSVVAVRLLLQGFHPFNVFFMKYSKFWRTRTISIMSASSEGALEISRYILANFCPGFAVIYLTQVFECGNLSKKNPLTDYCLKSRRGIWENMKFSFDEQFRGSLHHSTIKTNLFSFNLFSSIKILKTPNLVWNILRWKFFCFSTRMA